MTDLDDLIARLRADAGRYSRMEEIDSDDIPAGEAARICTEAAAALEALRAENERLRMQLAFARAAITLR